MKFLSLFVIVLCFTASVVHADWDFESEQYFNDWTLGSNGEQFAKEHVARIIEWRKDFKKEIPTITKTISNKNYKYDYTIICFKANKGKFTSTNQEDSLQMSYAPHIWIARDKKSGRVAQVGNSFMIPDGVTEGAHQNLDIEQEIFYFIGEKRGIAHLENW